MKAIILTTWLAISFLCCSCKSQDYAATGIKGGNRACVTVTGEGLVSKGPGRKPAHGSGYCASADTECRKKKSPLQSLLETMLEDGMAKEAKSRYIASIRQSPQAAFSAFGAIAGHMKKNGKRLELAEWCGALVHSDLPAHLKREAAIQRNEALIAAGRFHGVLDSVSEHLDALPSEEFQQVMEKLYNLLLNDKNEHLIDKLNSYCIRQLPDHTGLKELRIYNDIRTSVKSNLASAEKTLLQNAGVISDYYMAEAVKKVLDKADKENKTDIIKNITDMIFSKHRDMPATAATAATYWLELSRRKKDAGKITEKLQILLDTDIEPRRIVWLIRKSAYTVLATEDTAAVTKIIRLSQQLLADLKSEDYANRLRWILLDLQCFIEDFDSALEILDLIEEIPGQKISMLRNKINAHLAMKKHNWDDAITGFRKFMEEIKNMRADQRDLVTGNIIPYQSILGLNAKRIGDLYMKQDKQDEAVAAYREAIKYYTDALGKLSPQDNQREEVRKKLDELKSSVK